MTNSKLTDNLSVVPDSAGFDEREKSIVLEGIARAFSVGIWTTYACAVILALTGSGMWSVIVLFAAGLPSVALHAHCRKHGIDYNRVIHGYSKKASAAHLAISMVFLAAWLAAVAFHGMTGNPLINLPEFLTSGNTTSGLISGAIFGLAIFFLTWWMDRRRHTAKQKQGTNPADIPDED